MYYILLATKFESSFSILRKWKANLKATSRDARQSKAAIAVNVQNHNIHVRSGIQLLRDTAVSLLVLDNPSKRAQKELLESANILLALQGEVEQNIPNLIPSTCTKYAVNRLQSDSNHERKTHEEVTPPHDNMRVCVFTIAGRAINLPQNRL